MGTFQDEATLNGEGIKPVFLVIIELHLSEYIMDGGRESVSQSVSQSVSRKFD